MTLCLPVYLLSSLHANIKLVHDCGEEKRHLPSWPHALQSHGILSKLPWLPKMRSSPSPSQVLPVCGWYMLISPSSSSFPYPWIDPIGNANHGTYSEYIPLGNTLIWHQQTGWRYAGEWYIVRGCGWRGIQTRLEQSQREIDI